MYSLDSLMHDLNIKNYPSAWEDILDEAVNAYKELDVLKDSYIDYLNNKYDAFPKYYDLLKKAAAEIRSNEKLAVFTSLLCIAMRDRENIANQLDELDLPTAQDGECTVGYDLCAIFPFLQFADDMASYLEKRDVPKDVIVSTIREFEDFISEGTPMYDRPLMNKIYLVWGQLFIDHKIIRIERFNLEFCDECHMHAKVFRDSKGEIITLVDNLRIHKSGYALGSAGYEDENGSYHAMITETDTYYEGYPANSDGTCSVEKIRLSKSDWSCVLSHSDKTISVHIPSSVPSKSTLWLAPEDGKRSGYLPSR